MSSLKHSRPRNRSSRSIESIVWVGESNWVVTTGPSRVDWSSRSFIFEVESAD